MSGGMLPSSSLWNGISYGVALTNGNYAIGTVVAPSATAATKGSWVSLGTLSADAVALRIAVAVTSETKTGGTGAFDIGIGGSGSQVVLVPNIVCPYNSSNNTQAYVQFLLPLQLPSGVQVWARSACSAASAAGIYVASFSAFDGEYTAEGYGGVDALGFTAGTLVGTSLTTTGTGAKGSYSQVIASTARDYGMLFICLDQGTAGLANTAPVSIDIAIGASGSEKIIVPDTIFYLDDGYSGGGATSAGPFPVEVPAGSRIAVRGASDSAYAAITLGATIYGVYK